MKHLNILITDWKATLGVGWVTWLAKTLDAAVWIKAYDGARWLNLGKPFANIAHELQQKGVDVGAWGYHYGSFDEEKRLLECYFYRGDLQGYEGPRAGLLIDAEAEFERLGGEVNARWQVKLINGARIPVPIYYTSFAFPELHPSFPYGVFNDLSGGHVPQVYYNHRGWPEPAPAVLQCVNQHYSRGLQVAGVMLPIYDAGPESGWRPAPDAFHQATLAATMFNVPSVWTWTWEQHTWRDWTALWHYARLVAGLKAQ
jgi:hypothetical protein